MTHVDTSSTANFLQVFKTNLVSLKIEVDKLNFDKLVPVPTDLSKVM